MVRIRVCHRRHNPSEEEAAVVWSCREGATSWDVEGGVIVIANRDSSDASSALVGKEDMTKCSERLSSGTIVCELVERFDGSNLLYLVINTDAFAPLWSLFITLASTSKQRHEYSQHLSFPQSLLSFPLRSSPQPLAFFSLLAHVDQAV